MHTEEAAAADTLEDPWDFHPDRRYRDDDDGLSGLFVCLLVGLCFFCFSVRKHRFRWGVISQVTESLFSYIDQTSPFFFLL
jgi:hypothetical protein